MLKLDESLAAVFRQHLAGSAAKKSARDLAEQAQAFRVRCFDLLFVMLHSHPNAEVTTVRDGSWAFWGSGVLGWAVGLGPGGLGRGSLDGTLRGPWDGSRLAP